MCIRDRSTVKHQVNSCILNENGRPIDKKCAYSEQQLMQFMPQQKHSM